MIKRLDNVKLRLGESESALLKVAAKSLGKSPRYFKILKKSLDARDKGNIRWVYSLAFSATDEPEPEKVYEKLPTPPEVVVIGGGPAGLFCAIRLVEHGIAPVIIERGGRVEKRAADINNFFQSGVLNTESNVQFGEGGAGAFSDGKLNTQTRDGYNRDVLENFVRFGAPEEILWLAKPHVGSDRLYGVLQNIRKFIENAGGKYLFDTKFVRFIAKNGTLRSVLTVDTVTGEEREIAADCAVLAVGHSARDTFEELARGGIAMQPKDFAVGVRIEHLSSEIGLAQYGKEFKKLPAADYKLVSHAHERTVFTFCMCPGGVVIPAASEQGGVVTNGMSLYARDGVNSNSALMVQLNSSDYGEGLFGGMYFQREIERKAFLSGGGGYRAPVQLYRDFAADRVSQGFGEVKPTYAAGTSFSPLAEVLPPVVVSALKAAIPDMDRHLKGFACGDALLVGAETRFSSPVRILRDAGGESPSVRGVYPCGEGSGYSGGITSSAADGIAVAEKIFEKFKNH